MALWLSLLLLAAPIHAGTLRDSESAKGPVAETRTVDWRHFLSNTLDDQRTIWTSPVTLAHHQEAWAPAAGVAGLTAGLIAIDSQAAYFRRTSSFRDFNDALSGTNTAAATAFVPLSFYMVALLRHDRYGQQTSLLAGEAVAGSMVMSTVLKLATRRLRPSDIPPDGDFTDTWFNAPGGLTRGSSFPSGHTIAAFSIATVFADRYRQHRWVPWTAYGLATLVGFSRISLQSHFPSDVFAGAALGYLIAHYAVLRW